MPVFNALEVKSKADKLVAENSGNIEDARNLFLEEIMDWTDYYSETGSKDAKVYDSIVELWIQYSLFEISLKQYKKAVEVFETAVADPVGGSVRLFLAYAAFCIDRSKLANAQKVLIRGLCAGLGEANNQLLWGRFLSLMHQVNKSADLTLAQLYDAVKTQTGASLAAPAGVEVGVGVDGSESKEGSNGPGPPITAAITTIASTTTTAAPAIVATPAPATAPTTVAPTTTTAPTTTSTTTTAVSSTASHALARTEAQGEEKSHAVGGSGMGVVKTEPRTRAGTGTGAGTGAGVGVVKTEPGIGAGTRASARAAAKAEGGALGVGAGVKVEVKEEVLTGAGKDALAAGARAAGTGAGVAGAGVAGAGAGGAGKGDDLDLVEGLTPEQIVRTFVARPPTLFTATGQNGNIGEPATKQLEAFLGIPLSTLPSCVSKGGGVGSIGGAPVTVVGVWSIGSGGAKGAAVGAAGAAGAAVGGRDKVLMVLDLLEAMWSAQALKERHFDSWLADLRTLHREKEAALSEKFARKPSPSSLTPATQLAETLRLRDHCAVQKELLQALINKSLFSLLVEQQSTLAEAGFPGFSGELVDRFRAWGARVVGSSISISSISSSIISAGISGGGSSGGGGGGFDPSLEAVVKQQRSLVGALLIPRLETISRERAQKQSRTQGDRGGGQGVQGGQGQGGQGQGPDGLEGRRKKRRIALPSGDQQYGMSGEGRGGGGGYGYVQGQGQGQGQWQGAPPPQPLYPPLVVGGAQLHKLQTFVNTQRR